MKDSEGSDSRRALRKGELKYSCACSPRANHGEAFCTEQLETSMGGQRAGRLPGGGSVWAGPLNLGQNVPNGQ